jgi:DNA-binding Xre family transcriptional regulator
MTDRITVQVIQDDQDPEQLLLDLGLELCERLGWQPGDTLTWHDNEDGSWTLTKQQM